MDFDKPYSPPTSNVGRLVVQFKMLQSVLPDDREWDKMFFARSSKYAKIILDQVGTLEKAVSLMKYYGRKWEEQGLQWSLKAIADRAVLWAAQERKKKNDASSRPWVRESDAPDGGDRPAQSNREEISVGPILDTLRNLGTFPKVH